ncbi:hypothetical protein HDV04_006245 [Boothiomyces sp. JEL0838]|nr:hypothetical protein HDV04_006245 [Boothiomyces sp. JEL0838]
MKYKAYTDTIDLVDYIGEVQWERNKTDAYTAGAFIQGDLRDEIIYYSTVIPFGNPADFAPDYDTSYSWSSTPRPDGVANADSEVFVGLYQPKEYLLDYTSINKTVKLTVPAAFVLVKCELVEQKPNGNTPQDIPTASGCHTKEHWQTFQHTLGVGSCNKGGIYDIVVVDDEQQKQMHCAGEPYNGTALASFRRSNGVANITIETIDIQTRTNTILNQYGSVSNQGNVAATDPIRKVEKLPDVLGSPEIFESIKSVVVATILAEDLRAGYFPAPDLLNSRQAEISETYFVVVLNLVGGISLVCINICTLALTLLMLLCSTEISEVNAKTFLKWVKQFEQDRATDIDNLVDSDTVLVVSEVEEGQFGLKPV